MTKLSVSATLLLLALWSGAAGAQEFGAVARIAGEDVLFAQPSSPREPGTIFVYRLSGGSWSEAGRITASDGIPGDRFGGVVSVDGLRVLVGAMWADSGRGAAYVFERGGEGQWRETARLRAADGARGDSLGFRVALRGDVALVGYGATPDSGAGASVLVFRRDGAGTWREAGALHAAEATPGDRFGRALALGDDFAAVGGASRDSATGAVWVFPAAGSGFGEPTVVTGPAKRSAFGAELAVVDGRLLVGMPGLDNGQGAVMVLERNGQTGWREAGRILPSAPEPRSFFGSSIVPAGDALWIGAQGASRFHGAIHVVRRDASGAWVESARVTHPDAGRFEGFATTFAVGEGVVAAGLPGDDYGFGTGAILTPQGDGWAVAAKVFNELEPLAAVSGRPVTCTGSAAGFECSNVDLVSFIPVASLGGERGAELNDIWGWTDPQTGKEYALVGRQDGTSFVDLSDPENPVLVGVLPRTEGVPGSVWRDIKVYKDHAFIVADGAEAHGMQVFDLTRLRDVANAPATFTPETTYHNIHSAHNIVINEDTGFAYTVGNSAGGETCGGGLHMVDIRDPKNPTFAGCFSDPSTGRQKTGYTHDAQCVLYHGPDPDYQGREICFGSNETALSIADVTDKSAPVAISMAEYPNVGYTHQAWLTDDHHHLLMDDELDELNGLVDHTRTLIWDVSDLDDPVLIKEFLNPNNTSSDHNQYVVGDRVYQSNYVGGLRVIDISDIDDPKEVGFFDTVPYGTNAPGFDGSWSNYPYFKSGVIVVTSGDEGLFLLRVRPAGDQPIS